MNYVTSVSDITPDQLTGFFAGWPSVPSPGQHLEILEGSAHVVLAVDPSNDQVAGFVNAISDGSLAAFIPLLEVKAPYRGKGIGSELMRRMVHETRGYYMVDLVCDRQLEGFYERLGMQRLSGMSLRRPERLSRKNHRSPGAN